MLRAPLLRSFTPVVDFLGVVQIRVGECTVTLPVQAAELPRDDVGRATGGFFQESAGGYGILVRRGAKPAEVEDQIRRGVAEAVRHLSSRVLN
jgi:hypothetical protein